MYQFPEWEDGRRAIPCTVTYISYTFHLATKVEQTFWFSTHIVIVQFLIVCRHVKHRYLVASDDDIKELHQREKRRKYIFYWLTMTFRGD